MVLFCKISLMLSWLMHSPCAALLIGTYANTGTSNYVNSYDLKLNHFYKLCVFFLLFLQIWCLLRQYSLKKKKKNTGLITWLYNNDRFLKSFFKSKCYLNNMIDTNPYKALIFNEIFWLIRELNMAEKWFHAGSDWTT